MKVFLRQILRAIAISIAITVLSWLIVKEIKYNEANIQWEKDILDYQDSLKVCRHELSDCQETWAEHISECSFISRHAIKKWDGRYITLNMPWDPIIK